MEPDSDATETVSGVDADLDEKNERNKISKLKKDKYSTCHSE